MTEIIKFAKGIEELGGKAYYVGGFVRDKILNVKSHDKDVLIVGVKKNDFESAFPKAFCVGNQFPVYRIKLDNEIVEVAFARKEISNGNGHNNYEIQFSPDITLEEDLFRRDITMNSIALDILSEKIFDPFKGMEDIYHQTICATSEHFLEDPLRALRVARQAAKFNMFIEDRTSSMMNQCHDGILTLSKERIIDELKKALETKTPSIFFRELKKANILDVCFPEIFRLIGKTQPLQYHPEGDAFEHTMLVLDAVAQKTNEVKIRFAALMHDIGKGVTPINELPKHHDHDKVGALIIKALPNQYPSEWKRLAIMTSQYHMQVLNMKRTGKIAKLLGELKRIPQGLYCLRLIVEADARITPWFLEDQVSQALKDLHFVIPKDVANVKEYVLNIQAHTISKFKR